MAKVRAEKKCLLHCKISQFSKALSVYYLDNRKVQSSLKSDFSTALAKDERSVS